MTTSSHSRDAVLLALFEDLSDTNASELDVRATCFSITERLRVLERQLLVEEERPIAQPEEGLVLLFGRDVASAASDETTYLDFVLAGATSHPTLQVRQLCLEQLVRLCTLEPGASLFVENVTDRETLRNILANLDETRDSHVELRRLAGRLVERLGCSSTTREATLGAPIGDLLREIVENSSDSTLNYRVTELWCKIAASSDVAFDSVSAHGVVESLVREFYETIESADLLAHLNVAELMVHLLATNHGVERLAGANSERSILRHVADTLRRGEQLALIRSSYLRTLSHLAEKSPTARPAILESGVVRALASVFRDDNADMTMIHNACHVIASTVTTRDELARFCDDEHEATRKAFLQLCVETDPETRAPFYHTLGELLAIENADGLLEKFVQEQPLPLSERDGLVGRLMVELRTSRNRELRVSVFHVVKSLSSRLWGAELLSLWDKRPSFVEFVLDRSTEGDDKTGKEWKFSIVMVLAKLVSDEPRARELFGSPHCRAFVEYMREGPLFAAARPASVYVSESA